MNFLLDTHVFLWMLANPENISKRANQIITQISNQLFFSAASLWEISIKTRLKKLDLPGEPDIYIPEMMNLYSISTLPIQANHSLFIYHLPDIHKDPFDRMIISQSIMEDFPVITNDTQIKKYDVSIIW